MDNFSVVDNLNTILAGAVEYLRENDLMKDSPVAVIQGGVSKRSTPPVDIKSARAQLSVFRESKAFRLSQRLVRFLEFTIEKALDGGAGELKEYSIGVEVYERGDTFDPRSDSIVRSEAVRLRGRLRAYYETEGKHDTLRISYPKGSYVPTFECHPTWLRGASNSSSAGRKTIAVLPFITIGAGANAQFIADGLTEELISALGRVPTLRVVARSSCFQFQGKAVDVREAGRQLGTESALEGSVRCWRGRLRVTAQFVEVSTGLHLWSGSFDRKLGDLLAIQEEISRSILAALRLEALPKVLTNGIDDPESYRLYLKGRHSWASYSVEGARRSCAFYERALVRSPLYARAWAGLALSLNHLAHCGHSPKDNSERARKAINTALAIDDSLAEAHAANALLQGVDGRNWREAEQSFRRALALAPGDACILHQAGLCLLILGKFAEATKLITNAAELDPLACNYQVDLGIILRVQQKHDLAIAQLQSVLEIDPNHREATWQLGLALQQAGRYPEAMANFARATSQPEEQLPSLGTIGNCYAAWGRPKIAVRMLNKLKQAREDSTLLYARALIHAGLDQAEPALTCLEECVQLRSSQLILLNHDWRFSRLAAYFPRFSRILQQLGFSVPNR